MGLISVVNGKIDKFNFFGSFKHGWSCFSDVCRKKETHLFVVFCKWKFLSANDLRGYFFFFPFHFKSEYGRISNVQCANPDVSYLVLSWNGGQVPPVTEVSYISGSPGSFLVRRRTAACRLLYLLQPIWKQARGELRHIVALWLHQLPGALHAVREDVGGGVSLLPQPRTVHQQRRGVFLRQVRFLNHIVRWNDPGDGAPQGVALAQAEDTGKQCRPGKVTAPHFIQLSQWRPLIHPLVYNLTCICSRVCVFVTRGGFTIREMAYSDSYRRTRDVNFLLRWFAPQRLYLFTDYKGRVFIIR